MKRIIAVSVCALALSALPSVAWGQYAPQYYQPYPTYQAAQTPVYWWWHPPQQQQMPQRMAQPRPAMNVVGPVQQVQASLPQTYVQAPPKAEELPAPKADAPVAPTIAAPVVPDCCDACCNTCCHRGGFMGGAAWYFLKPHYDTNPAFIHETDDDGATIDTTTEQTDFDWNYRSAFSVWLAYVSPSGFGGRVRFWSFDNTAEASAVESGPGDFESASGGDEIQVDTDEDGEILQTQHDLELFVVDIEAIGIRNFGRWTVLASAGARLADLSQRYDATVIERPENVANGEFPIDETMFIDHGFRGAGPTIAFEAHRSLGGGALGVFGSARGALLVGEGNYSAAEFSDITDTGMAQDIDLAGIHSWDDVLPVLELELGVEGVKQLGGAEVFASASVVTNTWFGAGNASNNEFLVGDPGSGSDDAPQVHDPNFNLTFFGVKLEAGVRY